jgi:hypothetical protein
LHLLARWEQVPTPKPRGQNGPHPSSITAVPDTGRSSSTPSTSALDSLVAVLAASTTVMLNNMLQGSPNLGSQPGPHKRPPSPLPEAQDWLRLCLNSFGEERGLPKDTISTAITALAEKSYTPHELGDARLDIDRVSELTRLPEGTVVGLRNFAGEWVRRQTAKRSRLE